MPRKYSDHEKIKAVWFTAVSHDSECIALMKKNVKEFPFWGFIDHKPDKAVDESDKHFHTHFILRTAGSRSIKQVSDVLGCPPNFVQSVHQKRSLMRYFIHLDNPDKIQYSESDVHSNKISAFKIAWTDNQNDDVRRLFSDLQKLRIGHLTPSEFVDLHFLEFQSMPFYQKMRSFGIITELAQGLPDVPAHGAPR